MINTYPHATTTHSHCHQKNRPEARAASMLWQKKDQKVSEVFKMIQTRASFPNNHCLIITSRSQHLPIGTPSHGVHSTFQRGKQIKMSNREGACGVGSLSTQHQRIRFCQLYRMVIFCNHKAVWGEVYITLMVTQSTQKLCSRWISVLIFKGKKPQTGKKEIQPQHH
jgi:hypothetical protein